MFVFPIIYLLFFSIAVFNILKGKPQTSLIFIIFGLPIYITSLSIASLYHFYEWVPYMQSCKELVILLTLITVLFSLKKRPKLYTIDWLYLIYFGYLILYVLLPIGNYGIKEKLISLKNISFFTCIYFAGRFIDFKKINITQSLYYICLVTITAAILTIAETISYTHFQTFTGYADYMLYFFQQEPTGHHGLSWTFEAENDGPKRFASFFANPLDHAAGTLVTISAIFALATTYQNKIKLNQFYLIALIGSLCCIIAALSRASFASYFFIIYLYVYITQPRRYLNYFYFLAASIAILSLFFISDDLYNFIIGTLNFTNSSSAFHIIQWVEGIEAIFHSPLGNGLGSSGRISGMLGSNIGGENQLIIIAVQAGIIAVGLYIAIYIQVIKTAFRMSMKLHGKPKRIALFILMIKIGMIIPLLTAEAESYIYVGYITSFFTGLMINIKYNSDGNRNRYSRPEIG